MIKEAFYSGIGAIALTTGKFKELIEDLIQNGQLTRDEGKRLFDDFVLNWENKAREVQANIKGFAEQIGTNLSAPVKEEIKKQAIKIKKIFQNNQTIKNIVYKEKAV